MAAGRMVAVTAAARSLSRSHGPARPLLALPFSPLRPGLPTHGATWRRHVAAGPAAGGAGVGVGVGPAAVPAFDKYRVVARLQENGLDRKQAEAVMGVLNEVIRESLTAFTQQVVSKAEQEKTVYMYKADFAELKSELHMLEKNDFAILKGENDRLEAELDKVRAQMREEMNRLQGSVRLDMNLEKGRLRDDLLVQESKIKDTENRIDTEISNVRTMLETLKFDIIKYIVGSVASAGALLLGYWRLVKSGG